MTNQMWVRAKVGELFVKLTAKLYGGEISKNGINDSKMGNPDIMNWKRNQAYESKASISSDHHKISMSQIEHYQALQKSEFPLVYPEVYYCLWQHKKRGISKLKENELEKTLIQNINRVLVVSFDIIEAGARVWKTTGQNSWGEIYMFRSSERKALTRNTYRELEKMNLNTNDFSINQKIVPKETYKYKWWVLPELEITTIQNKKLKGIQLL